MIQQYPDSQRVADSFSRSAKSYDGAAILQTAVADYLLEQNPIAGRVLDLGCGTGRNTALIAALPEVSQLYALDIASGMLDVAQSRVDSSVTWLHADARSVPLANESLDVIYSSLVLQWLGPNTELFNELYRLLAQGGTLVFSTLLDGTLTELKQAWQQVDTAVHVNNFEQAQDWLTALQDVGFTIETSSQAPFIRHFDTALASMRELKSLGARNVNQEQPQGLTGRRRLQAFAVAYERFRAPEGLPATYQVMYITAKKPQITDTQR